MKVATIQDLLATLSRVSRLDLYSWSHCCSSFTLCFPFFLVRLNTARSFGLTACNFLFSNNYIKYLQISSILTHHDISLEN